MALLKFNVVFIPPPQLALHAQARARHVQADAMKRLALRPRRFLCRGSVRSGVPAGEPAEKTVAEGVQGLRSEFVLPEEHRHGRDAGAHDPNIHLDATVREGAEGQPALSMPVFPSAMLLE